MGKNFKLTISGIEPDLVDAVAKRVIELTQPTFFEDMEQRFSVKEVAAITKKTPATIGKHIRDGILKACKPGRDYEITESNLKKYINGE